MEILINMQNIKTFLKLCQKISAYLQKEDYKKQKNKYVFINTWNMQKVDYNKKKYKYIFINTWNKRFFYGYIGGAYSYNIINGHREGSELTTNELKWLS